VNRLRLCASLALAGAVATQLLATRYLPVPERLLRESWDELALFGAIGGALQGNLCWVAMKPSERVTRAALLCILANVLVWTLFLLFNPPLPESEFAEITARRAGQDSRNSLDIVDDAPIVVAGRWNGTFGAVNNADYALGFFAGPAVTFANLLVVPPRYIGSYATKSESWVTAGVGFVLSTSFWTAFGGVISALRRAYLRRQAARQRTDPVRR
jgi:hypothetical protein